MKARYTEVSQVLWRVFFLNLIVAGAKIALGLSSGAVSILSDGFHSLTDTASNIVALVGVRIASQPPDDDHPYGHRKFETMASVGILIFLLLGRSELQERFIRLVSRSGYSTTNLAMGDASTPPSSTLNQASPLAPKSCTMKFVRSSIPLRE